MAEGHAAARRAAHRQSTGVRSWRPRTVATPLTALGYLACHGLRESIAIGSRITGSGSGPRESAGPAWAAGRWTTRRLLNWPQWSDQRRFPKSSGSPGQVGQGEALEGLMTRCRIAVICPGVSAAA